MEPYLIHQLLERAAQDYPQKVSVLHGDKEITYMELNHISNRLAHLLINKGVKKGDRIIIAMENSIASIVAYYAVLKSGGISIEVPDKSTPREMTYFVENAGAGVCILSRMSSKRLKGEIPAQTIIELDHMEKDSAIMTELEDMPDSNPEIPIIDLDIASIIYTSGSTGKPKGVMLTHRNVMSNTASIVSYLGLGADDRIMVVLPFYYVYGKSLLNTHFMVGASVVINNRFAFPNSVIEDIDDKRATGFAGVPSSFAILMNRSIFPKRDLPSLRYMTQAGGMMAPALTRHIMEAKPGISLFIMYGSTEASPRLTYLPPNRLRDKLGSAGIPVPNCEITIRDDKGNILEPYEIGNICARGSNIMQGYWKDSEETASALKPWGLVTGDMGYIDDEGYIYITGRKKEMIKVGGERVSPREIEDVLIESSMVHEAAVIGVPDDYLSEVPKAYIVPMNPGTFSLDELKVFMKKRLSIHKLPKHWEVLRSLPKKASGKIDKEALKR